MSITVRGDFGRVLTIGTQICLGDVHRPFKIHFKGSLEVGRVDFEEWTYAVGSPTLPSKWVTVASKVIWARIRSRLSVA